MGRADLDIANSEATISLLEQRTPWAVINTAGYVRVDDAELDSLKCYRENVWGACSLATACARVGIPLVTFSSDLVFDGRQQVPYREGDLPAPLNSRFRCIMGTDYYVTNEHLLKPDGSTVASGEFFGYYVIAKQYYDRYGLPLMHTETNIREEEGSVQWLWKEWNTLLRLRQDGVPIVGFTWYSLTDQIDWDIALREERNQLHPVGLYDLDRRPRKVARLIEEWRDFLPAGSSALMLV